MSRRLLPAAGRAVLLVLAVSLLSFAFTELAPGDLLDDLRLNPRISPETVARLRTQYGLDRPLLVRYGAWLRSAAAGELGFSALYNQTVWAVLRPRARNTLELTVSATCVAWLLAVPLGAWAAARRGSLPDRLIGAGTAWLVATPDVLLAMAALWLAVGTGWFPAGGRVSVDTELAGRAASLRDALWHVVLPVTALVLGALPVLVRHVRAATVEALASPALLAARARGIPGWRLVVWHALRVAAPALASLAGLSLAGLLSGSLAVEVVMSWPGLGPLLLEATLARDVHLVVGAATVATVLLLAGTSLGDAAAWWLDPRGRGGERP